MSIIPPYNQPTKIFDELKKIAADQCLVEIQYQKSPIDENPPWRIIEPYSLSTGKQDIMLKAFQTDPEAGWRFFMIHKIKAIRNTGRRFTPRRKATVASGAVYHVYDPYESWTTEICQYRDLIKGFLADNFITPEEAKMLREFRKKYQISKEHVRGVHGNIFNECLTHSLVSDGAIDDEEMEILLRLNKNLTQCGCGILE